METVELDIEPTTLLNVSVVHAKVNVRQQKKRAPTAAHLRQRAAEADDTDTRYYTADNNAVDSAAAAAAERTEAVRCHFCP